jgi:hypothetical protein
LRGDAARAEAEFVPDTAAFDGTDGADRTMTDQGKDDRVLPFFSGTHVGFTLDI